MKKKLTAGLVTAMIILSVTACAGKTESATQPSGTAASAEASSEETSAAETSAEETTEAETAKAGATVNEGVGEEEEILASQAEIRNQQAEALEKADYKGFAGKIQKAFADKDIDALAELTAYPVYVGAGDGVTVEDEAQFKEMAGDIFSEGLLEVIAGVDISKLEAVQAGVVMSGEEGTPGVIFGSDVEGNMGITGITP